MRVDAGKVLHWPGEFSISSAPVVAGDVVVIGSAINDNGRADAPSGRVHAYDLRSGALRWSWDPLGDDASATSAAKPGADKAATRAAPVASAGAANVWAPMSVDVKRGLVFLPTSSPSPDFYGGQRPGNNGHADSVVALHVADGTLAWAFQVVKHDVWDYDLAAQPTLASVPVGGTMRDAVVQATKQGFVSSSTATPADRCFRSRSGRCRRAVWQVKCCRRRKPFRSICRRWCHRR